MKPGMRVRDDSPNICLVPNMEESSPIVKLYGIKKTCPPNSLIRFSTYIFGTRNVWRMMVGFLLAPSMMNHTKSNFIVVLWVISLEKL